MLLSRFKLVSDVYQNLELVVESLAVDLYTATREQLQHESVPAHGNRTDAGPLSLRSDGYSEFSAKSSELQKKYSQIKRALQAVHKSVDQMTRKAPEKLPISAPMVECEEICCIGKFRQKAERSLAVYRQFTEDKKRQMSYNDDQIHKYEKIKLVELVDGVVSEIKSHCMAQTLRHYQDVRQWFCSWYLEFKNDLEKAEEYSKRLRSSLQELTDLMQETTANVEKWEKPFQQYKSTSEGSFELKGLNVATAEELKKEIVKLLGENTVDLQKLKLVFSSNEELMDSFLPPT